MSVACSLAYVQKHFLLKPHFQFVSCPDCHLSSIVWDMREDPKHFEYRYYMMADHDPAHILDVCGRVDSCITKPEFVPYTLQMLVARSHYILILRDPLEGHPKKMQTLFAANRSPPIQDMYDFKSQPLSGVSHDCSVEITDSFDRASVMEKTKQKTRGNPDRAEAEVEPAHEPLSEPRLEVTLSRSFYSVFRTLFHFSSEKDQAPKLRWQSFVRALGGRGFVAQRMQGSQWQFNPSPALKWTRGISFHEPHPGNKVPWCLLGGLEDD
jgi:hypothetical protein